MTTELHDYFLAPSTVGIAEIHLLVVDDDKELRNLLGDYLRKNGYRVSLAADGGSMRKSLAEQSIDLIVLDLMLPGEDGLVLCRNLRVHSNIPVIMLTARGDETDRIIGLEMGADDYLPKPFNPRELLARIKSVLRRAHTLPDTEEPKNGRYLHFAHWQLDTVTRNLRAKDGLVVALSGAEYRLLKVFLEHANRVLSREQLLDLTLGKDADPFDRSIDVQISRLRQRLGDNAKEPVIIKTVRSEGYILSTEVSLN
ncbi:MAG: response regulator [Methylococcaceae bacterium]|nr:response regulator [Methylococcaceae bacterium]